MRGAVAPYMTRGQGIALPNGTLDNPAMRFRRERTGWYRAGDGRLAASIKKWRSLEITQADVFTRSNGTGATVIPLSISRATAASVGQETGQDIYDAAVAVGRETVIRESTNVWGRRWYVYSSGLQASPAMQLSGDGNLSIGAAGPAAFRMHAYRATTDTLGGVYLQGDNGYATAMLFGNTNNYGLATKQAIIGMGFAAAKYLGGDGDLSIYTATNGNLLLGRQSVLKQSIEASVTRYMEGATELARMTSGGLWSLGSTLSQKQLFVASKGAGDGIGVGAINNASINSPCVLLYNHYDVSQMTREACYGLVLQAGHFGATNLGDTILWTLGSSAGRLSLGTAGSPRFLIGTTGNVSVGASEGPSKFNVMQAADASGGGQRIYHSNATNFMDLWMTSAAHGVIQVNAAANAMFFDAPTGYVTIGASNNASGKLTILQASNAAVQGLAIIYGGGVHRTYIETDGSNVLSSATCSMRIGHATAALYPSVNAGMNLGDPSFRWAAGYVGCANLLNASLEPVSNAAYAIGASGNRWHTLYALAANLSTSLSVPYIYIGQTVGTIAQGLQMQFGGGVCSMFQDTVGNFQIVGPGSAGNQSNVGFFYNIKCWTPLTNNDHSLGTASTYWLNAYISTGTITTIVNNSMTSNLITMGGAIRPDTDNSRDMGTAAVGGRWRYVFVAGGVGIGIATNPAYLLHLGADNAGKPGSNTWTVISDRRVKHAKSIHPYTAGLEQLRALRPIHYRTNGRGGTTDMGAAGKDHSDDLIGLVAQEAQAVSPELVTARPGKLDEGGEETDILAVNTHAITFMLINAVVALADRMDAMESQLKGAA